jgi:hypothetical protein
VTDTKFRAAIYVLSSERFAYAKIRVWHHFSEPTYCYKNVISVAYFSKAKSNVGTRSP